MLDKYRIFDIRDEPITAVGTGLYIFHIFRASYLDIKNPQNPINVTGTIFIDEDFYRKIIGDLSKYNRKISDKLDRLDGIVIEISCKNPGCSQLKRNIKGKLIEILPDYNLKNKAEIITNNLNLYQLINYFGNNEIAVEIPLFQNYQSFNL